MRRAACAGVAALALAFSPLDGWLDASMPRLVLLAIPGWVALGVLAVRGPGRTWSRGNPQGLSGLAWVIGTLAFWMIPRSVDVIRTSEVADQLMHASLLVGGAALGASWGVTPFVVRGALGIYGAAMTIALGSFYSSYSALLCGTFDLVQQRQTGQWLLRLAPAIVLFVVVGGVLSLGLPARRAEVSVTGCRRSEA